MTQQEKREFREYLRNCTNRQVQGVYDKEKAANRHQEMELAIQEAERRGIGTVAKLAMRQPFVLFKGLTFQKLCLPGAFRPGDHHNKMLRPGLCVVHASPQYL